MPPCSHFHESAYSLVVSKQIKNLFPGLSDFVYSLEIEFVNKVY